MSNPTGDALRAVEKCLDCEGYGKYPAGHTCVSCGGAGYAPIGSNTDLSDPFRPDPSADALRAAESTSTMMVEIRKRDARYNLERWSNWVAHDRRWLLQHIDRLTAACREKDERIRELEIMESAARKAMVNSMIETGRNMNALRDRVQELKEALQEVIRISDRKHDAWDRAKAAIAKVGQPTAASDAPVDVSARPQSFLVPVVCPECGWEVSCGSHAAECSRRAASDAPAPAKRPHSAWYQSISGGFSCHTCGSNAESLAAILATEADCTKRCVSSMVKPDAAKGDE